MSSRDVDVYRRVLDVLCVQFRDYRASAECDAGERSGRTGTKQESPAALGRHQRQVEAKQLLQSGRDGLLQRLESLTRGTKCDGRKGRSLFEQRAVLVPITPTSIGQEGLDFHQYCHAVVHWNLPTNPLDLEQREDRVNRYKNYAVRKTLQTIWSDNGVASW